MSNFFKFKIMKEVFSYKVSKHKGVLVSQCSPNQNVPKHKVIKTLHTQGAMTVPYGEAPASVSVAYALLENGEVLVFCDSDVFPPYTKEQAKILMMADLGQDVYVVTK